MARGQPTLLDPLRRLITRQGGCALSDAELLEQYATRGDAASFEVLVWRHGAMVLGLCKRILREEHEAEDAFQATFLVFARKAGSVGSGEAVGCWLYKVAYRVALRLRATRIKHSAGEIVEEPLAPEQPDDAAWRDLRPVLDEEISRLPEKYRAPFVLCYLQGRTNEEAAVELGCPKGTVLSRLARGREWLRDRLTRRGLAPAAVALALNLNAQSASALVPALLAQSTAGAAIPFAAGTAAEVLPVHIAALAEGVIRTMIATKLKIAAAALVALSVLGSGIGWAASGDGGDDRRKPADPAPQERRAGDRAPQERGAGDRVPQERGGGDRAPDATQPPRDVAPAFPGKVASVAKDGKSFTVEVPAAERGAEATKQEIKLSDKTTLTYNGVGPNGATPTEGYSATVWLADNSKDTAGFVTFTGGESGRRGADVVGKLSSVVKDGKSITIEERGGRGAEPGTTTIPVDAKTVYIFSNVGPGGAKETPGMTTTVTYADDGKTAGIVQFVGTAIEGGRRDEKRPETNGKVVSVAKDGKTVTLEMRAGARGEEPTKVDIKLTDKSVVFFQNVGVDGAKPTEGQQAMVWLADGSKDTAEKIGFVGTPAERWTTITGKVASVGADGNSFTVEQPPTQRGEEPTLTEIKLTAKTKISFFGVGPDGAKLAEGMRVNVRLLDGSKDTASTVMFAKAPAEGRRER